MPFANTGQGQAASQGTPPLNAFDHIPFPGDPSGGRYTDQFATSAASYFGPNLNVNAYQSLRIWINWWNKLANTGSPFIAKVTLSWYADAGGVPATDPLSQEVYWIQDNGQAGGLLPSVIPAIIETPVKGYWLTYEVDPPIPARSGDIIYITITGQYRTLLIPQYQCDSAYFGVSGATIKGGVNERYVQMAIGHTAGTAAISEFLPTKSGRAHANLSMATVTGATAFILIYSLANNDRICGFSVQTTAASGDYGQDFLVPNGGLKVFITPTTTGFSNMNLAIVYEN